MSGEANEVLPLVLQPLTTLNGKRNGNARGTQEVTTAYHILLYTTSYYGSTRVKREIPLGQAASLGLAAHRARTRPTAHGETGRGPNRTGTGRAERLSSTTFVYVFKRLTSLLLFYRGCDR